MWSVCKKLCSVSQIARVQKKGCMGVRGPYKCWLPGAACIVNVLQVCSDPPALFFRQPSNPVSCCTAEMPYTKAITYFFWYSDRKPVVLKKNNCCCGFSTSAGCVRSPSEMIVPVNLRLDNLTTLRGLEHSHCRSMMSCLDSPFLCDRLFIEHHLTVVSSSKFIMVYSMQWVQVHCCAEEAVMCVQCVQDYSGIQMGAPAVLPVGVLSESRRSNCRVACWGRAGALCEWSGRGQLC